MFNIKEIILPSEQVEQIELLKKYHLDYEYDITYAILVLDEDKVIGTASIANNVMKCFAVENEYSGQNITGLMFNHLVQVLSERNIYHFFVFTTPDNEKIFTSFNMKTVVQTMNTVLLEGGDNIENVLTNLKKEYKLSDNKKGCIIVNANPMTNGHLYLIEEAAKLHDELLVFVVSEDLSSFPFKDRFEIINDATKHLSNVTVLPTLSYLVSKITFPKYFLKDDILIKDEQTLVDVLVYKEYYRRIFNITNRYVGTEPLSITTNKYNKVLKDYLAQGVTIIERKQIGDTPISASIVRSFIKNNELDNIKEFVPTATYDYLMSEKGQSIIKEIQSHDLRRH